MLVLIDESGDPGFKLTRGSSPLFVVSMVVFDDFAHAENASRMIEQARQALRVHREFKFSGSHRNVRDGFFSALSTANFRVRALIVDKQVIYSSKLREDTDCFYNFFVQTLIRHDDGSLANASVKIDGSGDREFKKQLQVYLRRQLPYGRVKKIKFVDSRSDNLVQLADMCAGAIARARRKDDRRDGRWLEMLQRAGQIEDLWDFR